MDDIPRRPQAALKKRGSLLCQQPPPPPPPPRAGKQEQHSDSSSSLNRRLATLKFVHEVDDNVDSDYEYVSNPIKMTDKQIANGGNELKAASVGNHPGQHNEQDGSERDGAVGAELVCGDEGKKQRDGGTVGATKGPFSFPGNACFESLNMDIDTTAVIVLPLPEQYPHGTCSKPSGRTNNGRLCCGGQSPTKEVKGGNMKKPKGEMPNKDSYQKLILETLSATHVTHEYQKLIKETMEPRMQCRRYSISDWVLHQTMGHSGKENNDNDDYTKLSKEGSHDDHEYQKLNMQTMEPSSYMLSIKFKHATI